MDFPGVGLDAEQKIIPYQIVHRFDVMAMKPKQIQQRIAAIFKKMEEIANAQTSISQKVWKKDVQEKFPNLESDITENETAIATQRVGVNSLWQQIPEGGLISGLLTSLQQLDFSLSVMWDRCQRMKTISQSKVFVDTLTWYNKIVSSCLAKIDLGDFQQKEVQLVELYRSIILPEVNKEQNLLPILKVEIRTLHIEALQFFLHTMDHVEKATAAQAILISDNWKSIRDQLVGIVIPPDSCTGTVYNPSDEDIVLMAPKPGLICLLEKEVAKLSPAIDSGRRDFITDPSRQLFNQKIGKMKDPFVRSNLTFSGAQKWYGLYPGAWEKKDEVNTLAHEIIGLQSEVEKSLKNLISNSADISTVQTMYQDYYGLYYTFQANLTQLKGSLRQLEVNVLVSTVLNGAGELFQILKDICQSLVLLKDFFGKESEKVSLSQKSVCAYLQQASLKTKENSLEELRLLYFALKQFGIVSRENASDDDTAIKRVMGKTVGMIEAILFQKGSLSLQLTKEEEEVWNVLVGNGNISSLFGEGKTTLGLPIRVKVYVEKCILKMLYFSEERRDEKLAIFIHVLMTDKYKNRWDHSCQNDTDFKEIIELYFEFSEYNNYKDLQGMREVFFLIEEASRETRDPIAYGKAWQKLITFSDKHKDSYDPMNPLMAFAFHQLQALESSKKYIPISEGLGNCFINKEFFIKDLSVSTELGLEVLKREKKEALSGLFYRALACSIWGIKEVGEARAFINEVLEDEELRNQYLENNQKGADFKKMISQHVLRMASSGNLDIHKTGIKIFREVHLKNFLDSGQFPMQDPRIVFALIQLVQNGNNQIIEEMTTKMGEERFEEWKEHTSLFYKYLNHK